jgi:hypothetical protein
LIRFVAVFSASKSQRVDQAYARVCGAFGGFSRRGRRTLAHALGRRHRLGEQSMPVDTRPAIPFALPRTSRSGARRQRLLRWAATAVTLLTALIAILLVAAAAVVLGIT